MNKCFIRYQSLYFLNNRTFLRLQVYFVLKKINNEDYSKYKLEARRDKIDYEFSNDPALIGVWESVDYVSEIAQFAPGAKKKSGRFLLTRFDIYENGKMDTTTSQKKLPDGYLTWTKGLIIDKQDKVASKYIIKELEGDTYLFYEWKSGDYLYRGFDPDYYVLKKVD